jgi:hypothetical protein
MPFAGDGSASAVRGVDRHRSVHPGWLVMTWRAIASWWAMRRREREIKEAVAALAEYDDRMLLDMGFPHRSQIEESVRTGRDCGPCHGQDHGGGPTRREGPPACDLHNSQAVPIFRNCRTTGRSERNMIALTRNR